MRYTRVLCVLLAATFAFSLVAKEPKNKNKYGVYMAGVSASFKDSLVYFTGVQFVDSAATKGNGFLVERAQYSEQMCDFMTNQGMANRTCFVLYNKNQKTLVKELHKLRNKYEKDKGIVIRDMEPSFVFKKAIEY